jgi:hypothetical protein
MKSCNIEGCNNPVWSKGLCKNHGPKTSFLTSNVRRTGKTLQHAKAVKELILPKPKMLHLFMHIWRIRVHKSEISGIYLGNEASSAYFHHILPKSVYPQAALDEENIILLHPDEHGNVEIDMYRYPEINRRRELLWKKYDLV